MNRWCPVAGLGLAVLLVTLVGCDARTGAGAVAATSTGGPAGPAATVVSAVPPQPSVGSTPVRTSRTTASATPARTSVATTSATPRTVTAVGDSLMVDAEPNLRRMIAGITIDGKVGREPDEGLSILQTDAAAGTVGAAVVLSLGTNGPFSDEQFDTLVSLADGRRIVVVTNHCDHCDWVADNNTLFARRCVAAVNCRIADWERTAAAHPEFFGDDGVHVAIGGDGAQAWAELVVAALR